MIKNFYFFTATILEWKHILNPDKYKDVIIESFKFLVREKRVRIFAFVIMPNHFHTVWKINESLEKSDFQRDTLKYTSQTILRDLKLNLLKYTINCMWERRTGSTNCGKGIRCLFHC